MVRNYYDFCHAEVRGISTITIISRMYIYRQHEYYVYIVTNPERTVLYTGVTNNLPQRLIEHYTNRGQPKTFAGKYYCYNLIYFECFQYINDAIAKEKVIKGW